MVSRESVDEVFLPGKEDCFQYLRRQRWTDKVTCPHCESADTTKKGTSRKDAQRYRCHYCDSIFNDLTGTIFAEHQLSLSEMFYIVREMQAKQTVEITRELDRTYKPVLDFVHEVQDGLDEDHEFDLSGVCEADEIYVTAGEKGIEKEDPGSPRRADSQKGRGIFDGDKPPIVTLVRRSGGRVRFLVRENLRDADEDIAEYSDGSVILYANQYGSIESANICSIHASVAYSTL